MRKETRTIIVGDKLNIERYLLEGIVQSFPNHFHGLYVILELVFAKIKKR